MPLRRTTAKKDDRRVVTPAEFGKMVLGEIDALVATQFKGLKKGSVTIALPFTVEVNPKGAANCTCKFVCTVLPDGSKECIEICQGKGCV